MAIWTNKFWTDSGANRMASSKYQYQNQYKFNDAQRFSIDSGNLTDYEKMVFRYILNRHKASQKYFMDGQAFRPVSHFIN